MLDRFGRSQENRGCSISHTHEVTDIFMDTYTISGLVVNKFVRLQ